jgi:hypothetical protein
MTNEFVVAEVAATEALARGTAAAGPVVAHRLQDLSPAGAG